jgi:hypothetical protein
MVSVIARVNALGSDRQRLAQSGQFRNKVDR